MVSEFNAYSIACKLPFRITQGKNALDFTEKRAASKEDSLSKTLFEPTEHSFRNVIQRDPRHTHEMWAEVFPDVRGN